GGLGQGSWGSGPPGMRGSSARGGNDSHPRQPRPHPRKGIAPPAARQCEPNQQSGIRGELRAELGRELLEPASWWPRRLTQGVEELRLPLFVSGLPGDVAPELSPIA